MTLADLFAAIEVQNMRLRQYDNARMSVEESWRIGQGNADLMLAEAEAKRVLDLAVRAVREAYSQFSAERAMKEASRAER